MTNTARRSRRLQGHAATVVSLTDLDRKIIGLLSEHRVVTSSQLELLLSNVPARTLRYRTERLHRAALLGRSRPYRESGSAPYHLWPTRRADALARGAPPPQGGARSEPNPLFLAHAAALTGLYVALATHAPSAGVRLESFAREGDAREPFKAEGRTRAIAPDALICMRDQEGRELLAFVELDLGTMSHARLKVKASGYAAYAADAAWTERHEFCPCLLFLTTSETRAVSFLKLLSERLVKAERGYDERHALNVSWFSASACALAREPGRALAEPCWDDLTLAGGGLILADCLRRGRAPYDAWQARKQAKREAIEAESERLRRDHEARRSLLQEQHFYAHGEHLRQFGDAGKKGLELLVEKTEPMDDAERRAFSALVRQLAEDPRKAKLAPAPVPPSRGEKEAVRHLVDLYRKCQLARLQELTRRYGEGPRLRRQRRELESGGLLSSFSYDALEEDATHDHKAREEQEHLRASYLARRERQIRYRKREVSLGARMRHGRAAVLALIDRDTLRICTDCKELVYPEERRASYGYVQSGSQLPRCHFCGRHEVGPWDERYLPELEWGAAQWPRSDARFRPALAETGAHENPDEAEWP